MLRDTYILGHAGMKVLSVIYVISILVIFTFVGMQQIGLSILLGVLWNPSWLLVYSYLRCLLRTLIEIGTKEFLNLFSLQWGTLYGLPDDNNSLRKQDMGGVKFCPSVLTHTDKRWIDWLKDWLFLCCFCLIIFIAVCTFWWKYIFTDSQILDWGLRSLLLLIM